MEQTEESKPEKSQKVWPEPKLNHEQRMFMLKMGSEGYTAGEIAKQIKAEFNIDITMGSIRVGLRSKKWQPFVERFREEYLVKVKSVPIANKRIRIDDLEKNRLKLVKMVDDNPAKTKSDRAELLMIIRRLNETICVAREEMENKPNMIQQISLSSYSNMSDEELQRRKEVLIAKATDTQPRRDFGIGDVGEGASFEDFSEPA